MPKVSEERVKLQVLAQWMLDAYLDVPDAALEQIARDFGTQLIAKLGVRDLKDLITTMQYQLAGIPITTE